MENYTLKSTIYENLNASDKQLCYAIVIRFKPLIL